MMVYQALTLLGFLLYVGLCLLILRMLTFKTLVKNRLAVAVIFFALCSALVYLFEFLMFRGEMISWMNLSAAGVMFLPAFFLFAARHHLVALGGDTALQTQISRFHQQKDEFLSMASHELRTPLSIITGFAEILVREKLGTLNDEQKRRVRKILMQGRRLNRIVDELLDLNRIRSGKVEVQKIVFDLVPVLKACYDDHVDICEQQHLVFEDHVPDVLTDVLGDLERVTHVVVNLLNNAIKYTPPGGKIILEARHPDDHPCVEVTVRDSGIGIDPSEQELIFNEFYRCNQPTARKYTGSGLGLAIVKQLVGSMGGKVWVESKGHGHGCTFTFTIPIAKQPATKK